MADEFDRYLESLTDKLESQLADVIREQGERLSAAQRERLQSLQQSPDETGDLEASCIVTEGSHPLEVIVQAGGETTMKEVREGSSQNYDYALAFEHGTSRQPARSFFYSTYDEMRPDIEREIEKAIGEALK